MQTKELSRLIVEFYERLSAWEDAVVKGTGLTTAQNHAIEIVGHSGAIKMKDLAAKIGVTTGTLTVAVDRLEEKKLMRRVPHKTDRRSFLIELTDAGAQVFKQHHAHHLELTEGMFQGLSEDERVRFHEMIVKLIDAIPGR